MYIIRLIKSYINNIHDFHDTIPKISLQSHFIGAYRKFDSGRIESMQNFLTNRSMIGRRVITKVHSEIRSKVKFTRVASILRRRTTPQVVTISVGTAEEESESAQGMEVERDTPIDSNNNGK